MKILKALGGELRALAEWFQKHPDGANRVLILGVLVAHIVLITKVH